MRGRMHDFVSPKARSGRPRKLTQARVQRVVEAVDRAKKGERMRTMERFAAKFGVHWRTVENAYREAKSA